ncbi:MAG: hypothetical protein WC516_09125 [Patescibacteria group bacterium]|jgi:hypothetical protein
MGDTNRFRKFADLIAYHFPNKEFRIADVASGKGNLQHELRQRKYVNVISWDKIKRNIKGRNIYKYGYFSHTCKEKYDLVIGLHPDEATDHIILYCVKNNVPFVVCPCCVKPLAIQYKGNLQFESWIKHLEHLADGFFISYHYLRIKGKNLVLSGKPKER